MPKKPLSVIRYVQEQLLAEDVELFSLSILSHLGNLPQNLVIFLNEKQYSK